MTDTREKQPAELTFPPMHAANYEVEIKAWPYNGIKSEDVIAPKLIYHIQADNFVGACDIAVMLRNTVAAIHNIWVTEIVRVQEWNR